MSNESNDAFILVRVVLRVENDARTKRFVLGSTFPRVSSGVCPGRFYPGTTRGGGSVGARVSREADPIRHGRLRT